MQKSEVRRHQEVLVCLQMESETRALLQLVGAPLKRSHFAPWEFVVFDCYSERSKRWVGGGDTARPCISKYCISLNPKGTIFKRPSALLFVSLLFYPLALRLSSLADC